MSFRLVCFLFVFSIGFNVAFNLLRSYTCPLKKLEYMTLLHTPLYILALKATQISLGYIQTGRANVKSTASLLYKNDDAVRPV